MCILLGLGGALTAWQLDYSSTTVAGCLLGIPLLLLSFFDVRWLLGLTLCSVVWNDLALNEFLTVNKLLTGALLAMTVINLVLGRTKRREMPTNLSIALMLLFGICLLAEMTSQQSNWSSAVELAGAIFFYIGATQAIGEAKDLRPLLVVHALNVIVVGALLTREISWDTLMGGVVRAVGPTGNPNSLASVATRGAPLCLALAADRHSRVSIRVLSVAGIVSCVWIAYAAASRGGSLALLAGFVAVATLLPRDNRRRILSLLAVSAMTLGLVTFAPTSFSERVVGTFTSNAQSDEMLSGRTSDFYFGLELIQEAPLLGMGTRGVNMRRELRLGRSTAIHVAYVAAGASHGIPAALIFAAILLIGAILGIRAIRTWPGDYAVVVGITSSVIAVIVDEMASPELYRMNVLAWPLLAMLLFYRGKGTVAVRLRPRPTYQVARVPNLLHGVPMRPPEEQKSM